LKSNPKGLKSNPNPWIYYSIGAVKKFTAPKLNPSSVRFPLISSKTHRFLFYLPHQPQPFLQ